METAVGTKGNDHGGGESTSSRGGVGLVQLNHSQSPATPVPTDAGHVGFDEKNSATAALFEVFDGGGVGNGRAVEAGAFIFDQDYDFFGIDSRLDTDFLSG